MKRTSIKSLFSYRLTRFLLILLLFTTLVMQNSLALQDTTCFTLDFEESLDGWNPTKTTDNSNLTIEHMVQESYPSRSNNAKLSGTTTYSYNFTHNNISIELTNSSSLDFSWLLENKIGSYTGLKLHTSGFGSLYIYSYFFGFFINTSYAGILEIYGEKAENWYNHTIDLYEAYMQIYEEMPTTIDYLYLINYPIGGGTNFCELVTYFDNITFNGISRENEEDSFGFDFEDNLDGWKANKLTSNSEFIIDRFEIIGYDRKAAKLVGTTSYRYNFVDHEVAIKPNENSYVSIEWMFENRVGAYSGIRFYSSDLGSLYIYSYFFGIFVNTSTAGIIEIYGEYTNVWHNRTINIYEAYMQIFGKLPKTIDLIDLINYPVGGGLNPSEQITYFDNIVITAEISQITKTNFSLFSLVIIIPFAACMVLYLKIKDCRM